MFVACGEGTVLFGEKHTRHRSSLLLRFFEMYYFKKLEQIALHIDSDERMGRNVMQFSHATACLATSWAM